MVEQKTADQKENQDETVEKSFIAQIKTVLTTIILPSLTVLLAGGVLKIDEYINFILGGVTLISCIAALLVYKAYLAIKKDRKNDRVEKESIRLDNDELKNEISQLRYEMNVMAELPTKIVDEINKDRKEEYEDLVRTLDENFKDALTGISIEMKNLMADLMAVKREISAELNYKSTKKYRKKENKKEVIPDGKQRIIKT